MKRKMLMRPINTPPTISSSNSRIHQSEYIKLIEQPAQALTSSKYNSNRQGKYISKSRHHQQRFKLITSALPNCMEVNLEPLDHHP